MTRIKKCKQVSIPKVDNSNSGCDEFYDWSCVIVTDNYPDFNIRRDDSLKDLIDKFIEHIRSQDKLINKFKGEILSMKNKLANQQNCCEQCGCDDPKPLPPKVEDKVIIHDIYMPLTCRQINIVPSRDIVKNDDQEIITRGAKQILFKNVQPMNIDPITGQGHLTTLLDKQDINLVIFGNPTDKMLSCTILFDYEIYDNNDKLVQKGLFNFDMDACQTDVPPIPDQDLDKVFNCGDNARTEDMYFCNIVNNHSGNRITVLNIMLKSIQNGEFRVNDDENKNGSINQILKQDPCIISHIGLVPTNKYLPSRVDFEVWFEDEYGHESIRKTMTLRINACINELPTPGNYKFTIDHGGSRDFSITPSQDLPFTDPENDAIRYIIFDNNLSDHRLIDANTLSPLTPGTAYEWNNTYNLTAFSLSPLKYRIVDIPNQDIELTRVVKQGEITFEELPPILPPEGTLVFTDTNIQAGKTLNTCTDDVSIEVTITNLQNIDVHDVDVVVEKSTNNADWVQIQTLEGRNLSYGRTAFIQGQGDKSYYVRFRLTISASGGTIHTSNSIRVRHISDYNVRLKWNGSDNSVRTDEGVSKPLILEALVPMELQGMPMRIIAGLKQHDSTYYWNLHHTGSESMINPVEFTPNGFLTHINLPLIGDPTTQTNPLHYRYLLDICKDGYSDYDPYVDFNYNPVVNCGVLSSEGSSITEYTHSTYDLVLRTNDPTNIKYKVDVYLDSDLVSNTYEDIIPATRHVVPINLADYKTRIVVYYKCLHGNERLTYQQVQDITITRAFPKPYHDGYTGVRSLSPKHFLGFNDKILYFEPFTTQDSKSLLNLDWSKYELVSDEDVNTPPIGWNLADPHMRCSFDWTKEKENINAVQTCIDKRWMVKHIASGSSYRTGSVDGSYKQEYRGELIRENFEIKFSYKVRNRATESYFDFAPNKPLIIDVSPDMTSLNLYVIPSNRENIPLETVYDKKVLYRRKGRSEWSEYQVPIESPLVKKEIIDVYSNGYEVEFKVVVNMQYQGMSFTEESKIYTIRPSAV